MLELNYLNEIRKQYFNGEILIKPELEKYEEFLKSLIKETNKAVKFILPSNGGIFNKPKGSLVGELKLPYPLMVLEYPIDLGKNKDTNITKKVLVIRKINKTDFECFMFEYAVPSVKTYLRRKQWVFYHRATKFEYMTEERKNQGYVSNFNENTFPYDYRLSSSSVLTENEKQYMNAKDFEIDNVEFVNSSIMINSLTVVNFLELLNCENVSVEKSKKIYTNKAKKACKDRDEYHILKFTQVKVDPKDTVDNEIEPVYSNSPQSSKREHLRRGHLRRYKSGKTIWIEHMVINEGIGNKVDKTYLIE